MLVTQVLVEAVPVVSDCAVQTTYGSLAFDAEKDMSGTSRTLSFGVSAV
jgi:hypothetical protein